VARALSLDEKLAAIGLMVRSDPLAKGDVGKVDIESTLGEAFIALQDEKNLRLLLPVFTWIEVHGSSVIIEKLIKILCKSAKEKQDTSLAALFAKFALLSGHKKWSTVAKKFTNWPKSPRLLGPSDMAASLLSLRGEEDWAKDSGYRVAKGFLATNHKWVLSRKALAKFNHQYRNRLIYGPQWRADIITAYEQGAKTPTEASQISGASYEPCHRVKVELEAAGLLASRAS
jgi:hypothetical protein